MAVRDVVRFVAEGSEDGSGRFEKVKEGAARSVMAAMEWRSAAMMSMASMTIYSAPWPVFACMHA